MVVYFRKYLLPCGLFLVYGLLGFDSGFVNLIELLALKFDGVSGFPLILGLQFSKSQLRSLDHLIIRVLPFLPVPLVLFSRFFVCFPSLE